MKNEFLLHLLGEGSAAMFLAALVFAFAGAFISLLLGTTDRNVRSDRTPVDFSWRFLWSDNSKRVYRTVLFIILSVRFSREAFGADITMYAALIIGLTIDQIVDRWTKKTAPPALDQPNAPL